MYNICVFAGTTEGRRLIEFLSTKFTQLQVVQSTQVTQTAQSAQPVSITACVATEYGETLLTPHDGLQILTGRMSQLQMVSLMTETKFDLVVDATHPYAVLATDTITAACNETGTPYLRLLREESSLPRHAVFVEDIASAVSYLNGTGSGILHSGISYSGISHDEILHNDTPHGNILLTTGSKELMQYIAITDFSKRVFARVLPMEESLEACRLAGLEPSHILAMQGPFSEEMNLAMLRSCHAKFLVTKETGRTGGFEEKAAAAKQAGAILVVIGRPPQRAGLSLAQTIDYLCNTYGFSYVCDTVVTIVGIGPGHPKTMTEEVRAAIEEAGCLIGSHRMLETAAWEDRPRFAAVSPHEIADFIHSHRKYGSFAVLMSGDSGFYSGTKKLLPLLEDCEVRVLSGISSLSCLCSRLGTSYEDVFPVSAHGRPLSIVREVVNHPRIFVLVGGENNASALCHALTEAGLGDVTVTVGERLSYPDEIIRTGSARELAGEDFHSLSALLIERGSLSRVISSDFSAIPFQIVTQGLPDYLFQRGEGDGGIVPMTKSEIRAICLSRLQLTPDAVCWDIGAGTGSVAVEMALQANYGKVWAIERREDALPLLKQNAERFHLENLSVVAGEAPAVCESLPLPTHVFIGGSAGNMEAILRLVTDRNPAARIVATAVTLESIGELTTLMKAFGFTDTEVVTVSVSRDRKAGRYHLMTAQNPVTIFTMQHSSPAPPVADEDSPTADEDRRVEKNRYGRKTQ